jgi:hypothetical protein
MVESRIPEISSGLVSILTEKNSPVEITPRHRKFLDAQYEFYGLDTTKKRIEYLNNLLGLKYTDARTLGQHLRTLELAWVYRRG